MKKQGQHASVKYLQVKKRSIFSNDKDGKNVKPVILLVTSELDMDPLKICVLELKCFKGKVNAYDIINFIRDFRIVSNSEDTYINISKDQVANEKIKAATGLVNLDALFLTKKEIDNLFESCILIDS